MNNLNSNSKISVRTLCLTSLLIAISLILANVKIFSTIALDSLPAFLGAIIISPLAGGIIGALGHFFTALTSGFPLTLPMHILIMIEMFIVVYAFGKIEKSGKGILAVIISIVLNGIVFTFISGAASAFLVGGMTTMEFFAMMVVPLTFASIVNIVLAYVLGRIIKNANIKI